MVKNIAMLSFITAILCYALAFIMPFFITPFWALTLIRLAMILFAIGVVTGLIHVLAERRREKGKEDWDKMKDY